MKSHFSVLLTDCMHVAATRKYKTKENFKIPTPKLLNEMFSRSIQFNLTLYLAKSNYLVKLLFKLARATKRNQN